MSRPACRSFPPSADARARVLVLGSMPGRESLRKQEYYAFERNAFWPITGEIFHFDPGAPYARRLEILRAHGVALWDVVAACERNGSLDTAIRSPVPNDIPGLLRACPKLIGICCNGTAAGNYLRRFFPDLVLPILVLPSTSPAAAAIPRAEKLRRWQEAFAQLSVS